MQLDNLIALEARHLRAFWKTEFKTGKLDYIIILISCIFAYVLSISFNAFLLAHLSVNDYADFSVAYRALNFVSVFLLFGSNMAAQKYIPLYFSEKNSSNLISFLKWNLTFVFKASAIFFLLCLCAFASTANGLQANKTGNFFYFVLAISAISPFYSYFLLFTSYINSIGHSVLSTLIRTVFSNAVLFIIFSVGSIFVNTMTRFDLSYFLHIFVLIVFFSSFFLYCCQKNNCLCEALFFKYRDISKEKYKDWKKASSVYLLNNMIYLLILTVDVIILKIFSGSAKEVAIYNICILLNQLFYLINKQLDTYLLPDLSVYLQNRSDPIRIQKKINIVNMISLSMLIFYCLIFLFFGSSLLTFFGIKYDDYSSLMILVCLSHYINFMSYLPFFALSDLEYYSFITKVNCMSLFLMVFLGIILVIFYGAYGIAIANLIARTVTFVIVYSKARSLTSLAFLPV